MSSISFVSATDILKDPFSGFKAMTSSRKICLPPRYLGNVSQGIRDQLDSEINLFCTDLQSVVIAYDNIKLLSAVGNIMDDSPFLHLRLQADYILFKPTLGCVLKGTVNKMSKDHVGCLVHDRFNASIHRPRTHLNGWRGSMLRPGEEFPFQVEDIYSNNSVISLKGKLVDQKIIEEYLKSFKKDGSTPCAATANDASPREDNSLVDSEGEITLDKDPILPQKRGRTSSGSRDLDMVDGNLSQSFDVISENDLCPSKSKKMKKKKRKHVHEDDSQVACKKIQEKSLAQSELESLTAVSVKKRKLSYSDSVNESVSVKKVHFDPKVVDSFERSSKKKRKKNSLDISEISGEDTSHLVDSSVESSSVFENVHEQSKTERKKKKKKEKNVLDISQISREGVSDFGDSSIQDSSFVDCEESEQSGTESKKKKKKKKKKKFEDDSSGEAELAATKIKPKQHSPEKESVSDGAKSKKRKEKKSPRQSVSELEGDSEGQENVLSGLAAGLGEIFSQMKSNLSAGKTKKKKNQKDLMEVMMALQSEVTKAASRLTTPSPAGRKKKKQKKKRKSEASSSSEPELDVPRDKTSNKSKHKSKSFDSYVLESEPLTRRQSVKEMDTSAVDRSVLESVTRKRKRERDSTGQTVHHDEELQTRKKKKKLKKDRMSV